MKVKVLVIQLCPTLCDALDYSLPSSSVYGISQARILEWLPFPFPRDLPIPKIEQTCLLHWLADSLYLLSHTGLEAI